VHSAHRDKAGAVSSALDEFIVASSEGDNGVGGGGGDSQRREKKELLSLKAEIAALRAEQLRAETGIPPPEGMMNSSSPTSKAASPTSTSPTSPNGGGGGGGGSGGGRVSENWHEAKALAEAARLRAKLARSQGAVEQLVMEKSEVEVKLVQVEDKLLQSMEEVRKQRQTQLKAAAASSPNGSSSSSSPSPRGSPSTSLDGGGGAGSGQRVTLSAGEMAKLRSEAGEARGVRAQLEACQARVETGRKKLAEEKAVTRKLEEEAGELEARWGVGEKKKRRQEEWWRLGC
jgi:hypothetical protein